MTPSALRRAARVRFEAAGGALSSAGDVEDGVKGPMLDEEVQDASWAASAARAPVLNSWGMDGATAPDATSPASVQVRARSALRRSTITPRFTTTMGNRVAPPGSWKRGDRSKKPKKCYGKGPVNDAWPASQA